MQLPTLIIKLGPRTNDLHQETLCVVRLRGRGKGNIADVETVPQHSSAINLVKVAEALPVAGEF